MNSEILYSQGVAIPKRWGVNHNLLTVLSYQVSRWDEPCAYHARRLGLGNDRPGMNRWRAARSHLRSELNAFVSDNRDRRLLFSSESLYQRLGPREIVNLRRYLEEQGVEARIVVYLRDPLSARVAHVAQKIKVGWYTALDEALRPDKVPDFSPSPTWPGAPRSHPIPAESYETRLTWWEAEFPGRVDVRLFDRGRFIPRTLTQDFCEAIGVDSSSLGEHELKTNVSLPWPVTKILNELNTRFDRRPLLPNGDFNRGRLLPSHELSSWDWTPRPFISSNALISDFEDYFSASNEFVRSRYFPMEQALWAQDLMASNSGDDDVTSHLLTRDELSLVNTLQRVIETHKPQELQNYKRRFALRYFRSRRHTRRNLSTELLTLLSSAS